MALTDPATGLPNVPYFCLIQQWEERRARRRKTIVRIIYVRVNEGGEGVRRALVWRLCHELRMSDLIASDGKNELRILLTSPDAECADSIAGRIEHLATELNQVHTGDVPLALSVEAEAPCSESEQEEGPCDPCGQEQTVDTAELSVPSSQR